MDDTSQSRELESAIERDQPFGPSNPGDSKIELPAEVLRAVLLRHPKTEQGEARLWLRRVVVTGALSLESQRIPLRLCFEGCDFADAVNLYQASGVDIVITACEMRSGLMVDQLDLRRNLLLDGSTIKAGASAVAARIGGTMSLEETTLEQGLGLDGRWRPRWMQQMSKSAATWSATISRPVARYSCVGQESADGSRSLVRGSIQVAAERWPQEWR